MIEIKNVNFRYKYGNEVLKNINLQIENGECIAVVGKNGEGKSTFLKIISGLLKPSKGNIIIDGIDAYKKNNIKDIRRKIGVVFQNPDTQLLFSKVYDEIEFSLKNFNIENTEGKILDALKAVDMENFLHFNTFDLSLGQKQRINIASKLAIMPEYYILDEPTSMIDSYGKIKIYKVLEKLKKDGKTIIFSKNNIEEILFATRIIILDKCEIRCVLESKEIKDNIEKLEKFNIYVPDMYKLIYHLNKIGSININPQNYQLDDIVNMIKKEINNEKYN